VAALASAGTSRHITVLSHVDTKDRILCATHTTSHKQTRSGFLPHDCSLARLQVWPMPLSSSLSVSSSFLACNSRLRSAIRRHHPLQRAVLSQICCFGERKMVMFQILLNGAEPCDAGTTQLSSCCLCAVKKTEQKIVLEEEENGQTLQSHRGRWQS